MSTKYKVILSTESKQFYIGDGNFVTIKNETIVDKDHIIAQRFPSYCVPYVEPEEVVEDDEAWNSVDADSNVQEDAEVGEVQLLNEEPISEAEDEVVETPTESEEVAENIADIIDGCKTKDALETLIKEKFDVDMDKRKSLLKMKAAAKEIAGV